MKTLSQVIQGIETLTVCGEGSETAVIFLHGYGANMHDLFPLWEIWNFEKADWFFPNGVLSLPMGYYEGRAWFSIDMARLEKAMLSGAHRDMAREVPVEFAATMDRLSLFVQELSKKYKKIILGGFSQGAMLSAHLAARSDLHVDGLILLSGNLIAQDLLPAAAKAIPFIQAHGDRDPILSLEGAKALHHKLQAMGFSGKLITFSGGHEIPMSVINEVKYFIQKV